MYVCNFSFNSYVCVFSHSHFAFFGGRPWLVHGPLYSGMCVGILYHLTFSCILNLECAWGSSGHSLGTFKSITLDHLSTTVHSTSPHETSSLEMGVVLCSKLDITDGIFYILYIVDFPSEILLGICFFCL